MIEDDQAAWRAFQAATGRAEPPYDVFFFGDSPELADELAQLVLSGEKRATCCRLKLLETLGLEPPAPGALSLMKDGQGRPRGVIETVQVDIAPFNSATDEFALEEGEGDKSLAYWRDAHLRYFERECAREGATFSEDELCVFERFRLIWTAGSSD